VQQHAAGTGDTLHAACMYVCLRICMQQANTVTLRYSPRFAQTTACTGRKAVHTVQPTFTRCHTLHNMQQQKLLLLLYNACNASETHAIQKNHAHRACMQPRRAHAMPHTLCTHTTTGPYRTGCFACMQALIQRTH
jgi:hypothetical protein